MYNVAEMNVTLHGRGVARDSRCPWLLLVFSLPAARASERVAVWRKLQRHGAVPLKSSGYVLPNTVENQERFEWLATEIRSEHGEASVAQVQAIDDLPHKKLQQVFVEARSRDYEKLMRELRQVLSNPGSRRSARLMQLRRRFQEISAIDFFNSPQRSRTEALLERAETPAPERGKDGRKPVKSQFKNRTWITRPRPGIDRVSSAWLIQRFIDSRAKFTFGKPPRQGSGVIPFDMFQAPGGFGHRGEDCTFETLCKEFDIRDSKVKVIAQIIHDADLEDEKFGRSEGLGLDKVLKGWASEGIADHELLRRGIQLIEGLYQGV
jgi:hypothetical protein